MSVNNYDDSNGTSWILNQAGRGQRARRDNGGQAFQPVPPPKIESPLPAFGDEIREQYGPPRRSIAKDALIGGVLGAALVHVARKYR